MIEPKSLHPPLKAAAKCARQVHDTVCTFADKLVLAEETDEKVRFRRRLHIHVCMLMVTFSLTFLLNGISASIMISMATSLNSTQELLDYWGRF